MPFRCPSQRHQRRTSLSVRKRCVPRRRYPPSASSDITAVSSTRPVLSTTAALSGAVSGVSENAFALERRAEKKVAEVIGKHADRADAGAVEDRRVSPFYRRGNQARIRIRDRTRHIRESRAAVVRDRAVEKRVQYYVRPISMEQSLSAPWFSPAGSWRDSGAGGSADIFCSTQT